MAPMNISIIRLVDLCSRLLYTRLLNINEIRFVFNIRLKYKKMCEKKQCNYFNDINIITTTAVHQIVEYNNVT
jgi:hypothetical protein